LFLLEGFWGPEICPGLCWGSSRCSPKPSSRLGRGHPQETHPLGAFGASFL